MFRWAIQNVWRSFGCGRYHQPLAQTPASVTEHTTLNLESPGPASVEARRNRQVDSPSSAS
jgi:hypothetical protein